MFKLKSRPNSLKSWSNRHCKTWYIIIAVAKFQGLANSAFNKEDDNDELEEMMANQEEEENKSYVARFEVLWYLFSWIYFFEHELE